MKKPRVRKIKVRYINSSERQAEARIDKFLSHINAARSMAVLQELRQA